MQRILTYRLFENPDIINYEEPREIFSTYSDEDGVAFGYINNKMKVELGGKHFDIIPNKNNKYITLSGSINRNNIGFAGRLWLNTKVISFWIYPSKKELKNVLNDLEVAFNKKYPKYTPKLDFSDPDWLIEVIGDFEDPGDNDWDSEKLGNKKPRLIPLSEYTGSEERDNEEIRIPHLMDWREKEMIKKKGVIFGKGFGSDMTAWDSKNPLPWRQAKYQESMKVKFNEFLNENKTEYTIYCDMDGVLTDFDGDFKRKYLDEFNKKKTEPILKRVGIMKKFMVQKNFGKKLEN
ncbi:MAG: hypothetical protein HPY57_13290 [Ignavibacteria bacterium]|nr:hypothetical protein [Ignavibacteria bacterium]